MPDETPAHLPPHHKPPGEHQCPWCASGTPHPPPIHVHVPPRPGP